MTAASTGADYIRLLYELAPRKGQSAEAIQGANDAWDAWEQAGVSRGQDTDEVIADPDKIFINYFHDVVLANKLGPQNVSYCYAKTGDLNAYACTTGNGDYVVVFDSDLQRLINALLISGIVCVYSKPTEEQVDFFFNYMLHEIALFKSHPDARYNADDVTKIISQDYELTMVGSYCGAAVNAFILCHELAHHTAGHTRSHRSLNMLENSGNIVQIDVNDTSHEEEFEADAIGFDYFCNVVKQNSSLQNLKVNHQFLSLPLIFFKLLEIVQKLFPNTENTHPEPFSRFEKIRIQKSTVGIEEEVEIYEALEELLSAFDVWCEKRSLYPIKSRLP